MVSSKAHSMYSLAADVALTSDSLYCLGAVITKGKRVLCKGCNHNRTRILGCYECHTHAEMAVVSKYLHAHGIYDIPWNLLKGRNVEGAY